MSLAERTAAAIADASLSGRLWLYSNYHCNLACRYCLTESSPSVPKRTLGAARMIELVHQAEKLGFTGIGITGGEPFLLPEMVDVLEEVSGILPVTVLSNGTLFNRRRLHDMRRLAGRDIRIQISLDRPDPVANDMMRGAENHARVIEAVPKLVEMGIHIRIATTVEEQGEEEQRALSLLVRSLGIAAEDHVIRKVVTRGRAVVEGLGVEAPLEAMPPELTITAAGAFWSPFAPTYSAGRLQTDLLISRVTSPLSRPLDLLLEVLGASPRSNEDAEGFV